MIVVMLMVKIILVDIVPHTHTRNIEISSTSSVTFVVLFLFCTIWTKTVHTLTLWPASEIGFHFPLSVIGKCQKTMKKNVMIQSVMSFLSSFGVNIFYRS